VSELSVGQSFASGLDDDLTHCPSSFPSPPPQQAIVKLGEGFNGADMRNICTEAGLFAIRAERDYVVQEDFMKVGVGCAWSRWCVAVRWLEKLNAVAFAFTSMQAHARTRTTTTLPPGGS